MERAKKQPTRRRKARSVAPRKAGDEAMRFGREPSVVKAADRPSR